MSHLLAPFSKPSAFSSAFTLVLPACLALVASPALAQSPSPAQVASVAPGAPAASASPPPPGFVGAPATAPVAPVRSDAASNTSGSSSSALGVRDKIDWGLRLGYANPSGSAWGGMPIDQMTGGVVFGQVDVHYALGEHLRGGVYGALGIGSSGESVSSACDRSDASCTVFMLDIGFQAEFRPLVDASVQPWVGASLGADVLSQNVDYGAISVSYNVWGPAVAASAGVDFGLGAVTLGPYISYKLGWYTWVDVTDSNLDSADGDIEDIASHRWFTIGMRGSHGIGG